MPLDFDVRARRIRIAERYNLGLGNPLCQPATCASVHAHRLDLERYDWPSEAEPIDFEPFDLIADCHIDAKHSFEDVILPVEEFKRRYGARITPLGNSLTDYLPVENYLIALDEGMRVTS